MKINSKAMSGITIGSALIIATSTILTNVLIKNNSTDPVKPINPLNRDKTYHHYSIIDKMSTNEKLSKLINFYEKDGNVVYFVDEDLFITNFREIVRETLKAIPAFSHNYLNYEITCNYKIKDTKSIYVDLVWQLPNNINKYFDQFVLKLESF